MASDRRERDAYFTPEPLARAICARLALSIPSPASVLEPSAGAGVFVASAKREWPSATIVGFDVEPAHPSVTRKDFFDLAIRNVDLVIGNPPWVHADRFVARSLELVKHGGHVAFLLRTGFWHGQERTDAIYRQIAPLYWIPLRERPSYTDDGRTDQYDSSVFVWRRGFTGYTTVLPHLSWRPERRRQIGDAA